MVIPITAPTIGPDLGLFLPEKFFPGTRVVISAANIIGFAIENANYFAKKKKRPLINQLQKMVEKGQAPSTIDRFDKGNPNHNEDDHVHFNNGSALYRDGTWKHGYKNLTNSETKFLNNAGWTLP